VLGLLAAAAAIAACIALYVSGHASSLQAYLVNGPLGRNGMLAAFCLIFLSELGDKTFFIAALLAMKLGRWISFVGSVAALAVMTLISVGIGAAFSKVPDALKSSLPVGEIAGVALLVFFGIKALKVGAVTVICRHHAQQCNLSACLPACFSTACTAAQHAAQPAAQPACF
jgi:hypothetical protein